MNGLCRSKTVFLYASNGMEVYNTVKMVLLTRMGSDSIIECILQYSDLYALIDRYRYHMTRGTICDTNAEIFNGVLRFNLQSGVIVEINGGVSRLVELQEVFLPRMKLLPHLELTKMTIQQFSYCLLAMKLYRNNRDRDDSVNEKYQKNCEDIITMYENKPKHLEFSNTITHLKQSVIRSFDA